MNAQVWRKSRRSVGEGNCVEVAALDKDDRAVRDSKNPTGPVLACSPAQWATFTDAISRGEFG